jgi:protein SCO1/2
MAFAQLVGKPAPNFHLFDQFGGLRRLSSFRGKGVLLTFISSRCTSICPLTAVLLRRTQQLMGALGSQTQLVAVNANRRYTSVSDVMKWSRLHRMTRRWLFLTGPPIGPIEPVTSLSHVWSSYGVTAGGSHTTVVFLIDPTGRIRNVVPIANKKSITAEAQSLAKYMTAVES